MLSFKRYLIEAAIPETNYGYWVDTNGVAHVVPHYDHTHIASSLGFGSGEPGTEFSWHGPKESAMHAGWLHLVANRDDCGGDFDFDKINFRQWLTLRDIVRHATCDSIHFFNTSLRGQSGERSHSFPSIATALAFLQTIKPKAGQQ